MCLLTDILASFYNNRWCLTVEDETMKGLSLSSFKLARVAMICIRLDRLSMTSYGLCLRYLYAHNNRGCQLPSKLTFLRFSGGVLESRFLNSFRGHLKKNSLKLFYSQKLFLVKKLGFLFSFGRNRC